ncbi:uncharacterized protein LOC126907882 [Daktulosphaira vitifoliae]|uniref:uncharacterized protein LOC126907882 n=1 Tax=Daktulosphaira vitifoliae TaxID=58002 RepID=UPI0021AA8088|nr:uncharacterized protein LOC126907882 [Daktulosphaira vitifoliae]
MAVSIAIGKKNCEELSDYEKERLRNIMEMQEQFSDLFDEVKRSADDLAITANVPSGQLHVNRKRSRNPQGWRRPNKIISKLSNTSERIICVRRSARIRNDNKKADYNDCSDDEIGEKKKRQGTIRVMFPFFKKVENQERDQEYYNSLGDSDFILSDDDIEYDDDEPRSKRKRNSSSVPVARLTVSQVTEEMLANITYSSCGKKYSADKGTTCHQCRQKTLDQKSYCRYKECRGVRGMFCGFCLGKRYGEDVAEVLLNPKWVCPPCRGYCNCSICRRKKGREPTGALALQASAGGYKSVRHMLSTIEGEAPSKTLSSDSENEEIDSNDEKENHQNLNNFGNVCKGFSNNESENEISDKRNRILKIINSITLEETKTDDNIEMTEAHKNVEHLDKQILFEEKNINLQNSLKEIS